MVLNDLSCLRHVKNIIEYLNFSDNGFLLISLSAIILDKNECKTQQPQYCQFGCINLVGSYRCSCQTGFVQDAYWNQCVGK